MKADKLGTEVDGAEMEAVRMGVESECLSTSSCGLSMASGGLSMAFVVVSMEIVILSTDPWDVSM